MAKVIIVGGDGFCGWPTALRLAANGHEILILDNLSRRSIDNELSSGSLTNIFSISKRISVANKLIGKISFKNIDVAKNATDLRATIQEFSPSAIVHFGEQRAAPYSMIGDFERRYTIENNISGTHNICSAIADLNPNIHLIHLGTMGVYGYSKELGSIPEGYLNVKVNSTGQDLDILYPTNPGSIYHLSKSMDQLLFQFYNKNWGLKITDLHQGIVWGIETEHTRVAPELVNRFDYDGIYGTVLNRFISQAANGIPLTIYGTGGQSRAFIHISDTTKCIEFALLNDKFDTKKVRIFNQVSEVQSVIDLARIIEKSYGAKISFQENPRKELSENELEVSNAGLLSLGFEPVTLSNTLIEDVKFVAEKTKINFDQGNIMSSPEW